MSNLGLCNGFITNVCTVYMIECVAWQPHCQMLCSHVDSCEPFKFEIFFIYRDRDHHLKTFKSVIPAYKLVEWLVSQVMWKWTRTHRNTPLYYINITYTLFYFLFIFQSFILGFCTQFMSYFCSNFISYYSLISKVAPFCHSRHRSHLICFTILIVSFCRVTAHAVRMRWPSVLDSAMLVSCTTVSLYVHMFTVLEMFQWTIFIVKSWCSFGSVIVAMSADLQRTALSKHLKKELYCIECPKMLLFDHILYEK